MTVTERIRRCGPLSTCARNGHADRIGGGPLEDHVWRDEDPAPTLPSRRTSRRRKPREDDPTFEEAIAEPTQ